MSVATEVSTRHSLKYKTEDSISQLAGMAERQNGRFCLTILGTVYELVKEGRFILHVLGPRKALYFIGFMPRSEKFYIARGAFSREFTLRDVAESGICES